MVLLRSFEPVASVTERFVMIIFNTTLGYNLLIVKF